jgi:hypothetical protein
LCSFNDLSGLWVEDVCATACGSEEVEQDAFQHVFVHEEEAMGPCVESVGNLGLLALLIDDAVNDVDDLLAELVEIEDGRVGIEAHCVETIAVLHRIHLTLMMSSAKSENSLYYSCFKCLRRASPILAISSVIFPMWLLAIWLRYLMNSLVSVEVFMPEVEEISFCLFS